MTTLPRSLCAVGIAMGLCGHAVAIEPGAWNAALRYRYEGVTDDAFARDAQAHTTRLRLGWRQPLGGGFVAWVEGEAVAELSDRFNSTANGETAYPVVADARAVEINQAALQWRGTRGGAVLGRQRVVLDNQRFVGNVGWRQNEQTFDAMSLDATPFEALTVRYHWLDRVHRVNGDEARDPLAPERNLDAHLFNLSVAVPPGQVIGYAYLIEDEDVAASSSRTLGLRWSGSRTRDELTFGWSVEAARQGDYGNNSADFSHDYRLIEPSLTWAGITWKAGWERLDGDGTHAFQTPLASLHAFNGWADKFLVTPAAGLEDRYLGAGAKFGRGAWQERLNWNVVYHDFQAARGDAEYGREWDAVLGLALGKGWSGALKLADYRSDGFARDTRKVWLQIEWTR